MIHVKIEAPFTCLSILLSIHFLNYCTHTPSPVLFRLYWGIFKYWTVNSWLSSWIHSSFHSVIIRSIFSFLTSLTFPRYQSFFGNLNHISSSYPTIDSPWWDDQWMYLWQDIYLPTCDTTIKLIHVVWLELLQLFSLLNQYIFRALILSQAEAAEVAASFTIVTWLADVLSPAMQLKYCTPQTHNKLIFIMHPYIA